MVDGLEEREALRDENVELVDELRASQARIVAAVGRSRAGASSATSTTAPSRTSCCST